MKRKNLTGLSLNKKTISKIKVEKIVGGGYTETCVMGTNCPAPSTPGGNWPATLCKCK